MDSYDIDLIKNRLPFLSEMVYLKETDSTNSYSKSAAISGAREWSVYIAETQTAGRGRLGRSWFGAANDSAIFSFILEPRIEISRISMITLISAMAVRSAIMKLTGLDTGIKWPNDLLIDGKKICGILCETILSDHPKVIIGIGLNVHNSHFPEIINNAPASLDMFSDTSVTRNELVISILEEFKRYYETLTDSGDFGDLAEEYMKSCICIGKKVALTDYNNLNTKLEAIGVEVDRLGRLIVNDGERLITLDSGEIST